MKIRTRKFIVLSLMLPCVLLAGTLTLPAHEQRLLLVDTDMALDDMRALVMLCNLDSADIRLITTSDGALAPRQGAVALRQLLERCGRGGISLAAGRNLPLPPPTWRVWSGALLVGPVGEAGPVPEDASHRIVQTLRELRSPSTFLCLGPLTNLAEALAIDPGIQTRINRVVYMGSQPDKDMTSWNTERDMAAVKKVMGSGLPVYFLDPPGLPRIPFDEKFAGQVKDLGSPAARLIVALHGGHDVQRLLANGHLKVWDELAVIFLGRPDLFHTVAAGPSQFRLTGYDQEKMRDEYLRSLGFAGDLHLDGRPEVVLDKFPAQPGQFQEDLRPRVAAIIEKHGLEEWNAAVLTNEFHRHLGIYSIVGVKMGMRAREILAAPFDGLKVVSLAGSEPPLSCLSDGLQIATGASLGRGNIRVEEGRPVPGAVFLFQGRRLTLALKKDIMNRIESDVDKAILKFGTLSPHYFARIRQLSIDYWYDLDRNLIFDEKL